MQALSRLQNQVEPLVDFFRDICTDINTNVDEDLEGFLRPIINGIEEGDTPDEVKAIHIGRVAKNVSTAVILWK